MEESHKGKDVSVLSVPKCYCLSLERRQQRWGTGCDTQGLQKQLREG